MALKAAFFDAVRSTPSDGTLSQHQVDVFNAISAAWDKYGDTFGYADMRLAYGLIPCGVRGSRNHKSSK